MARVRITQVRSAADRSGKQQATIRALGIRRVNQTVVQQNTPEIRGMIRAVRHLVSCEEEAT